MTELYDEIEVDRTSRCWVFWDQHHARIGWIVVGLLAGLLLGWWVGGLTSCVSSQEDCEVSVGAVEAAGTWFGAVGGILAVGAGIATLRSAEAQRLEEQRRLLMSEAERQAADLNAASQVKVRCQIGGWLGDNVNELRMHVTNLLSEDKVHKISGEWDGFGSVKAIHTLDPGKTHTTTFMLSTPRTKPGGQWQLVLPQDERDAWVVEQRRKMRIQYEINGQWWQRVGDEPPTRARPRV